MTHYSRPMANEGMIGVKGPGKPCLKPLDITILGSVYQSWPISATSKVLSRLLSLATMRHDEPF